MKLELRWYQQEAIDAIYAYFSNEEGNPLVCVSTGGGKSVIIAAFIFGVIERWHGQRFLIISHVKEIIEQNHDKMHAVWEEAPTGVYSAAMRARDTDAQILFASIQSIHKRAEELGYFDLVLIDECHLLNSENRETMYYRLLEELKAINPAMKIIGFTATPYRVKQGLLTQGKNPLFTDIIYETDIQRLIDDGYLSPLRSKSGREKIDLDGVRTRQGDYLTADMESAVQKNDVTEKAVTEVIEYGKDRKAWLIFCVSVAHAEQVKELLIYEGINAECITGETPKYERVRILADFKEGKIKALTSQGVLTTGFDAPLVDLIVLLRATKSPGLYVQILGRGLRISPETGKTDCLVLDYGGNITRHGPIDQITIGKIQAGEVTGQAPVKECPECFELILAGLRICPACQYQFLAQDKHDAQATGGALLSNQIEPEWLGVDEVLYDIHEKMGKPPSLQVTYRCGFETIREWVCFQHGGYAQQKAEQWWMLRCGIESIPDRTKAAHERITTLNNIREPCRILVRQEGKWHRILNHDLTPKPGTPSEWNADLKQRSRQPDLMLAGSDEFDTEFDF
ncbi:DEAD/DEAH box helicase [Endozoicomonas euniceicola]|uniref:DEAD/DEAH box helicase n=1 Tax=Endozoicomonas euniceicola TaxID=1234143 RepID=A0ABY6GVV7_9GAMM|nr:DEAD/DEAH box helicase [Endozoicomonas euniceicola]UYM16226.1 DEAD/DEAH box helicase [Endozoicomonas euniceicola]